MKWLSIPCGILSWLIACIASAPSMSIAADDGLQLIDNSDCISQVVAINATGQIVGLRDVASPGVGLTPKVFFRQTAADGANEQPIPPRTGFTGIVPEAISDSGDVVGHVTRIPHAEGSFKAFVWNGKRKEPELLPVVDGFSAARAFDVSADGRIVSGYVVGRNPPREIPCVWQAGEKQWTCHLLDVLHAHNPALASSRVVVSDDGTRIAACITAQIIPGPNQGFISHLFTWEHDSNGDWHRRLLAKENLGLRNINNEGVLVGSQTRDRKQPVMYNPGSGFHVLPCLEGHDTGNALDVNNSNIIVGYSEDPREPDGGPRPVLWRGDQIAPLPLPDDILFGAAAAINDAGDVAGYFEPDLPEEAPPKTVSFVMRLPENDLKSSP